MFAPLVLMIDIQRALKNDRLMRAMTGLNRAAFDELLPSFSAAYEEAHPISKNRKRAPGGGRKSNLKHMSDKLFFALFYFKCYPTFDLAGFLFDFDRAQAHRWLHRLQPVLEAALDKEMVLPDRQIRSMKEFIERFPDVDRVIIDGVERPIQRPQDKTRQRCTYSGKKKRNNRKQLGACDQNKRIVMLTTTHDGKFHDKCLLDCSTLVEHIPDTVPIQADLGFKGLEEEYENVHLPHKRPRARESSPKHKRKRTKLSAASGSSLSMRSVA